MSAGDDSHARATCFHRARGLRCAAKMSRTAFLLGWLLFCTSSPALAASDAFFRARIAPLFERHCVVCHHGEKPKGGLSLATSAGFAAGGESGKVIEPGKPDDSLLVEMVSGD